MVVLRKSELKDIESRYHSARRRLLLFDYDGTLVPIVTHPADATPDKKLVSLLKKLNEDTRNTIVVVSGRPHEALDEWLGDLPIEFVAEHGVMRREKDASWHMMVTPNERQTDAATSLLKGLAARHEGVVVEKKRVSTTLHYRLAPTLSSAATKLWAIEHKQKLEELDLKEIYGKKILELVPHNVSKGKAVAHWLERAKWDFILAAGDDATDETMFQALPAESLTFHIGDNLQTIARYTLSRQAEFVTLLKHLVR